MSGKTQIDIVHVLGWMGNLSRTLVIRREIGRFKNRETKPSWGLLIRSVFSSSFGMSCSAVLQCCCPHIHNMWRQRGAGKSSIMLNGTFNQVTSRDAGFDNLIAEELLIVGGDA